MKDLFIEDITPATILAWQNDLKSMDKTNNTINMSTEILYSIYQYNCKMHVKTKINSLYERYIYLKLS